MGARAGIVVCVTSFLLGALFTHWIADSLTLWKSPVTDEHLWTAASYYSILAKGPAEILYFLAGVVLLGGFTILCSLNDLRAGNIMFDGGSIFLFGTTIAMYMNSVLPSERVLGCGYWRYITLTTCAIAAYNPVLYSKFKSLPIHQMKDPFPGTLRLPTLELASNNLVCSVALTGVLALQAGRFWAEKSDDEDDEEYVMVESEEPSKSTSISRGNTPESPSEEHEISVKPFGLRMEATS